MARFRAVAVRRPAHRLLVAAAVISVAAWLAAPAGALVAEEAADQHLLVSEVMTAGATAADEFIEIYNPGPTELPLEGLELVYVSATGTTPGRRAAWAAGAPVVASGAHVLIANEGGIFASIADAVYASGLAAAAGSVALRIQGASSALDAVGWGTAANAWMEGSAAPAPQAGASIERLPGGPAGSTQDSDDNQADFTERTVPDPQNSTSPPTPEPGATPTLAPSSTPTPSATFETSPTPASTSTPTSSATPSPASTLTPQPTPSPTTSSTPATTPSPSTAPPTPTPVPTPAPMPIADARALPDGATAVVAGVALTASDFTDGGGYVADATGGIAVLVTGGAFIRGDQMLASGVVDDRYAQRTLRADGAGLIVTGSAADPQPRHVLTGGVGEAVEGQLVRVTGVIDGSPTPLTDAMAFDLDDGSGVARVVVGTTTGISLEGWASGARLDVVGVVGQRDSSGTGSSGYRILPRGSADVLSVTSPTPAPSPTSAQSPSPSGTPSVTASPNPSTSPGSAPLVSLADARAAAKNTRLRVRGVVTMGSGIEDARTAAIQDATGAILLRISDEAGAVQRGALVEVSGTRSTYGGMETLRVTQPPVQLGGATEPEPARRSSGAVGEADEAQVVVVRGSVVATPRRSSSGTLSFEIDDGSGAVRIVIFAAVGADREALAAGSWVEVTGVVGQQTSGSQPTRGYRIWPRDVADVDLLAAAVEADEHARDDGSGDEQGQQRPRAATTGGLERLVTATAGDPAMRADATLVAGAWAQLGLAGVLWDGVRAVGIAEDQDAQAAVSRLARSGLPAAVQFSAGPPVGLHPDVGLPIVGLESSTLQRSAAAPNPPADRPPTSGTPTWVRVSGLLERSAAGATLRATATSYPLEVRCHPSPLPDERQVVAVQGIGVPDPARVFVSCEGVVRAASLMDAFVPPGRVDSAARTAPAAAQAAEAAPGGIGAVLLLAAGIIGLVACAIQLRRRGLLASGRRTIEDAVAGAEDGVLPGLALVQLPRDRGSR